MNNHLTIEMKSQGWVNFETIKKLRKDVNFSEINVKTELATPEDSDGDALFFSIKHGHNLTIAWGHLFDDWIHLKNNDLNWDIERAIFMGGK